jgi:hypothetical protein
MAPSDPRYSLATTYDIITSTFPTGKAGANQPKLQQLVDKAIQWPTPLDFHEMIYMFRRFFHDKNPIFVVLLEADQPENLRQQGPRDRSHLAAWSL